MPRRTRSIRTEILAAVYGQPLAIYAPVVSAFIYGGGETYDDVAAVMAAVRGELLGAAPSGADDIDDAENGDRADRAAVHPATARAVARRQGDVVIIPIKGAITHRANSMEAMGVGISTDTLSRQFRQAVSDPDVKAIVFDIESPGGTVPGVDALANEIFSARGEKPIVAQVNGIAASAAYWIASAADEIVAPAASYTGSIGVYTLHIDQTAKLEMDGLKVTPIASTPDKVEELPIVPLSDDAKAHIQERVNHFDAMFIDAVARGRGMRASDIRSMEGRGRLYAGRPAVERGLVDRVRTLSETLAAFGIDMHAPQDRRSRASAARRRRELDLLEI